MKEETAPRTVHLGEPCCDASAAPDCCCCGGQSLAPMAAQAFGSLMKTTASGGAVDARTKLLISFALAVAARCGPSVSSLLKQARKMNIPQEALDEAAWCAVAMGGAPVKVFYAQALCKEKDSSSTGCCS